MNQQALADSSRFCQESFKRMHELRAEKLRAEVEVAKGVTSLGVAVGDFSSTKETCWNWKIIPDRKRLASLVKTYSMEQQKWVPDDLPPWKLQFLNIPCEIFMGASNGPGCSHGRYQLGNSPHPRPWFCPKWVDSCLTWSESSLARGGRRVVVDIWYFGTVIFYEPLWGWLVKWCIWDYLSFWSHNRLWEGSGSTRRCRIGHSGQW